MRESSLKPGNLHTFRLALVFSVLSLVFLAVLALAPLRPYFSEWRRVQQRYNALAERSGAAPLPVGVQQIWKPQLGVTDRCVTCHLGMSPAGAVPGDPLFRAHPAIPHDPREYGCTLCHGGQGRATSKSEAHGFVSHWDEQMLPGGHFTAGCGSCHTRIPPITRADLTRGSRLVENLDCLQCHRIDGRGRGKAPDLSYAGLKGYRSDWHSWHLEEQGRARTAEWKAGYGPVAVEDQHAIDAFLRTRIGAPRMVEAQSEAMERGCLGCHKIGGRGGDEGPVLDGVGRKPVGDLKFDGVPGEKTFVNYLRRHFLDPAGVVPGSLMPPQAGDDREADLLTSYVLFLRGRDLPADAMPKERLREKLGTATVALLSGDASFRAFCTGCHGSQGEGRNFANAAMRFPAVTHPDFLGNATDAFLQLTLEQGRSGRRMAAFAAPGGSLSREEAAALIAYLRSREPVPPSVSEVERAESNPATGQKLYQADCAACHGPAGEGSPLGSPLASRDSRIAGKPDEAYRSIVSGTAENAMPRYRGYTAGSLRSLLDTIQAMPRLEASRAAWKPGAGRVAEGRALYARNCAGCHGPKGEGRIGPALANPGFQKAGTESYIAATIVRGRAGTPMPAFGRDSVAYPRLTAEEVLDIAAFVKRGWDSLGQ